MTKNAYSFFTEDVGVILSRLGDPQSAALLRDLFDMSGRRAMRYVVLLVRVGHRRDLDEAVESLIAPSDAYPVEQRAYRLGELSKILPIRLPADWEGTAETYSRVYRWYQSARDQLQADKDGYCLTLGKGDPWKTPVYVDLLEGPSEPVLRLASGKSVPVQEKWVAGIREIYVSDPVLHGGALYQVGQSGAVYRIDLETGTSMAVYKGPSDADPPGNEAGRVAFYGHVMLFASTTGRLIGVDTRTWQPIWERPGLLHQRREIGVCGLLFVLETQEGNLLAIRAANGTTAWSFQLRPPSKRWEPGSFITPYIAPAVIDNMVVVPGRDSLLWIDAASGEIVRESARKFTRVSSELVSCGGRVYTTDDARKVVALSWETGALLWEAPITYVGSPENVALEGLPDGLLTTESDGIRLLSYHDGRTMWHDTFPHSVNRPTAAASDRFIFCLVSEEDRKRPEGSRDEGCVLVVYRRGDYTRIGEWRVGSDERAVFYRLIASGDEVYVGIPVHCIKVYGEP